METNYNTEEEILIYLGQLEGFKTTCKKIHWSARKIEIHRLMDDLYNALLEFQDYVAEQYNSI